MHSQNISQKYVVIFLSFLSVAFGVFTIFTQLAFILKLNFDLASKILCIATPLCTYLIFKLKQSLIKSTCKSNSRYIVTLIFLSLIIGAIAASINSPEEDDSLYIPEILQFLENPYRPLTDELNWIVPFSDGAKLHSIFLMLFNSLTMFWGLMSYQFHLDFLFLYQVCGAFLSESRISYLYL